MIVQFAMAFPGGTSLVQREFRAEVTRTGEGHDVSPLDSPELDYYGIDWVDFEDAAIEAYLSEVAERRDTIPCVMNFNQSVEV